MTDTLIAQIHAVRATGRVNMFSIQEVFEVAFEFGFTEMCDFLFLETDRYVKYILSGQDDPQE